MPTNITFRTQLVGSVHDFCDNCGVDFLSKPLNLVELIVILARLKEEGASLSPKIYITNNVKLLLTMLPDSEVLNVGKASANIEGLKLAVKKCAPLAIGGWQVYINDFGEDIEYGLFRGTGNPISVPIDDVIMGENGELKTVNAYQVAEDCVEIKANNGSFHYVFLNHRKEESPPPLQYLDNLVQSISSDVKGKYKEALSGYLKKLIFESLRKSHGCIIAVTNMTRPPRSLSEDGIIFSPPIDFANLVEHTASNSVSPFSLDSKKYLVQGMLQSDGILLFDSRTRLLGYNIFIKVTSNNEVIGGARNRAFLALSNQLGRGLKSVFIQSQDGWSDFKDNNNE